MTEKLYIVGHPIAHSKSPVMYNAVYREAGLDWDYGAQDIETPEKALEFLRSDAYLSVNITTPYKPCGFEVADILAASAKLSHGVNLLIRAKGKLLGYNVDGAGCISFLERMGVDFANARVAVCGTGPTSLAILHEAAVAGANEVLLLGRDRARARRILERYLEEFRRIVSTAIMLPSPDKHHRDLQTAYDETTFKFGTYETSTKAISSADIIIDATPLGMNEADAAPFAPELIHEGQTIMDTVYGHGETALVRTARERGARAFDGAGMLVSQAALTATMLSEVQDVDLKMNMDTLFATMAKAAGFSF